MTDSFTFNKLLEEFGTNQRAQAALETELRQLDVALNQRAAEIKQTQGNLSKTQANQLRLQNVVAGLQEELRSHTTELNFQLQTRTTMQDLLDSNEIEAKGTQQEIIKAKSAFVRDALEEHMKVLHKAALLRETFRNNT